MNNSLEFTGRRKTGEIYRDSLRFILTEWKPLTRLIALYVVPFIVVYAGAQVFMQIKLTGLAESIREMEPDRLMREAGPFYKNLLITLGFYIFVQSLFMGAVYSYITGYVNRGRNEFSVAHVVPSLSSNALTALGASLAVVLVSVWGLFLLIIPGIILANSLSLTPFIAIHEKKGIYPALLRSFTLTGKAWWNTLVLNLMAILIPWGINFLITLPVSTLPALTEAASANPVIPAALETWQWIYVGAALAISSLFSIFGYLFLAFQYFNLKSRMEEP